MACLMKYCGPTFYNPKGTNLIHNTIYACDLNSYTDTGHALRWYTVTARELDKRTQPTVMYYKTYEEVERYWQESVNAIFTGVYISGPMTGRPENNIKEFHNVYETLVNTLPRNYPYRIYNPIDRLEEYSKLSHEEAIRKSLVELLSENNDGTPKYSHLLLLDGYNESRGAVAEFSAALFSGKRIYTFEQFRKDGYRFVEGGNIRFATSAIIELSQEQLPKLLGFELEGPL